MGKVSRKDYLYLVLPALQYISYPFIVDFTFKTWFFYILMISLTIGVSIYLKIKNRLPWVFLYLMYDIYEYSKSKSDVVAAIGISTTFFGLICCGLGVIGIIYMESGYAIFAIALLFILFLIATNKKVNRKIWKYCFKVGFKIQKLKILGFILPFVISIGFALAIRFYLYRYPDWTIGFSLLFFVTARQLYYIYHILPVFPELEKDWAGNPSS